ncbi:MAG: isoprenylcysteine carboxylmethyltransferase family protein [Candidatus Omnitrophica bacterium]|nr:isoprenylcysteine carboxylmethyltransferase family protein [Candidatus Omnitrophota bacterium]
MKKRLKINGVIIVLAVILLLFFPSLFFRSVRVTPWDITAKIVGLSAILLGQIFRASGRGYKSEHSHKGHSLIKAGPYGLVRNPMYLGILLIGTGIVLILFNWWIIFLFLPIFIWRYILLMFKEEKKLLTMFSGEYQDYQRKVPRILPSFAAISTKDIAGYLPLKVSWLKKEIGSMLAVLCVVLLLEAWKDSRCDDIRIFVKDAVLFFAVIIIFVFLIRYLIRRTKNQ